MSRKPRSKSLIKRCVDALLAPAQDPRQVYTDPYEQQRYLLTQLGQALQESIALQAHLESRIGNLQERLPNLEQQARHALRSGREDQARLALQRRQIMLVELQNLETQLQAAKSEQGRLADMRQQLEAQIEALATRQEMLSARYQAAMAQVRLSESLSGVSQEVSDLGQVLEQAEQRAEYMQARAAAIDHLFACGALAPPNLPANDGLLQHLNQLDLAQEVEDQLARLKED